MNEREELLACPFCGGPAEQMGISPRAPEDWVRCTVCKASSDTSNGRSAEKWNARTVAQAVQEPDDWQDDPSADERWNAGLDFGMVQLCAVLGVDPHMVNWDAATETLDGDVCAAIGNIFRTKYGDDFDPTASPLSSTDREAGK